jgi:hypothetical protein
MADQTIVPQNQAFLTQEELYRQYGEATIQFKIAQGKVMQLEQQIQAFLNQQAPAR